MKIPTVKVFNDTREMEIVISEIASLERNCASFGRTGYQWVSLKNGQKFEVDRESYKRISKALSNGN